MADRGHGIDEEQMTGEKPSTGIRQRSRREIRQSSEDGLGGSSSAPFQGSLVQYHEEKKPKRRTPAIFHGRLSDFLALNDFSSPEVWRAAAIEGAGTGALVFVSTAGTVACLEGGFEPVNKAVGLIHVVILSLFILATAPSCGGHLNPSITTATVFCGLTSPARGVLYVLAQTVGAIVGALILKGILSHEKASKYQLAGCLLHQALPDASGALVTTGVKPMAGLLSEFAFTYCLLFVAFGIALNPKQGQIFGPVLAPFLIGGTLGLMIFISGDLMGPGYTGAGMNPARCFGPAVALGGDLWTDHWVFWVGPLLACVAHGLLYNLIPPYHHEVYASGKDFLRIFRLTKEPGSVEMTSTVDADGA